MYLHSSEPLFALLRFVYTIFVCTIKMCLLQISLQYVIASKINSFLFETNLITLFEVLYSLCFLIQSWVICPWCWWDKLNLSGAEWSVHGADEISWAWVELSDLSMVLVSWTWVELSGRPWCWWAKLSLSGAEWSVHGAEQCSYSKQEVHREWM